VIASVPPIENRPKIEFFAFIGKALSALSPQPSSSLHSRAPRFCRHQLAVLWLGERRALWAGRRLRFASTGPRGNVMASYVTLFNFTPQGLSSIKDTIKRLEAAKRSAAQTGVSIREVVWTQGQYDIVAIWDAADETAANAFILTTMKAGNVRGQTLRAFSQAEMQKILDRVG
jgi:uncharacterized protein with GYD domain